MRNRHAREHSRYAGESEMIVDHIRNAERYETLDERIAVGLKYLSATDLSGMPNGRVEIRNNEIYAVVNRYETKPCEQGKWETHRNYIDIQYMVEGSERIGFGDVAEMKSIQDYDEEKDCEFFTGEGNSIALSPGMFAILLPHEAHMPGLSEDSPTPVTKVVVKVAVR